MISIVAPEAARGMRRFPAVYLGPSAVYADRDVDAVVERSGSLIDALGRSYSTQLFLVGAVRIEERYGLFVRDFYNRSVYRRKLVRAGAEFAEEPFVELTDSRFSVADWGSFSPSFVIADTVEEQPTGVEALPRGLVLTQVGALRMGRMTPADLGALAGALGGADGFAGARPEEVVSAIRSS